MMGQLSQSHDLGGGLKSRHVTMLSIAGVIGASLFVGSSVAIAEAGPAVLLSLPVRRVIGGDDYAYAGRNGRRHPRIRAPFDLRRQSDRPLGGLYHRLVVLVVLGPW